MEQILRRPFKSLRMSKVTMQRSLNEILMSVMMKMTMSVKVGLTRSGENGESNNAKTGMTTTPVLVKTFLGMSCKPKRFRSCRTKC